MVRLYEFLKKVLDTITEHIVVIDDEGNIIFVNLAWVRFGNNNSCLIDSKWEGVNYLNECDKAANMGDDDGIKAAKGIRKVIKNEEDIFYFEYPCHSSKEKRWFMMRVTPFTLKKTKCFVISHQNITERKLAEEEIFAQSRLDGLTNIANRGFFDDFLDNEWKRCIRLGLPLSLAIIDIDHFKLLNDTYGHQAGDDCLIKIGEILNKFARRPSDICARYGGDEFAILYGESNLDASRILINGLIDAIRGLTIPNEKSPTKSVLTVSIGLATILPTANKGKHELMKSADTLLYVAKNNGRNQVAFSEAA